MYLCHKVSEIELFEAAMNSAQHLPNQKDRFYNHV